ncbi:MAG: hypothetical protein ACJ8AD_03175, partial [Gemmatimonadaceae bacterium]
CDGRNGNSFELLQHPADHSVWLSDSQWPAMPIDHASIHPLLVSPSPGQPHDGLRLLGELRSPNQSGSEG